MQQIRKQCFLVAMMPVREVSRKRKFMLLILIQLLEDSPATIERRVGPRVDKTKKGTGSLSYPVSRISSGRHSWVWRVHEDASCQVPSIGGGCRAPFNKGRDPYEDIYCTKQKTCPHYQILGNRRDVPAPFLPVSDWQEYCVSDCNGSM